MLPKNPRSPQVYRYLRHWRSCVSPQKSFLKNEKPAKSWNWRRNREKPVPHPLSHSQRGIDPHLSASSAPPRHASQPPSDIWRLSGSVWSRFLCVRKGGGISDWTSMRAKSLLPTNHNFCIQFFQAGPFASQMEVASHNSSLNGQGHSEPSSGLPCSGCLFPMKTWKQKLLQFLLRYRERRHLFRGGFTCGEPQLGKADGNSAVGFPPPCPLMDPKLSSAQKPPVLTMGRPPGESITTLRTISRGSRYRPALLSLESC